MNAGYKARVDSSRANAGMLALVLVTNYLILKIIKISKKSTDRAIECSLEVLGLAITLKERQRQGIKKLLMETTAIRSFQ